MDKKNSVNNDFLRTYKARTTTKVYDILVKLVKADRQDLAEVVVKIDYLVDYCNSCIKAKDFNEAKEVLSKIKERLDLLKENDETAEYMEFLYEGLKKKIK